MPPRYALRVASTVVLGLCSACASTSVQSLIAPDWDGRQYSRIMVIAPFTDIGLRATAERATTEYNDTTRSVFYPSHQVFFPGRTYADLEFRRALDSLHVDAILFLTPGDVGTAQGYIPQLGSTTRCTAWTSTLTCSTSTIGGIPYTTTTAQHTAQLLDRISGRAVWIASLNSAGSDLRAAVADMADSALLALISDRVVKYYPPRARP